MSNNPPFPASDEYQQSSEMYAQRDKPGAQDKTKFSDPVVPQDASRTGIPIVVLGKSREVGGKVAAFLRPEYTVLHHAISKDELLKVLPTLTEPKPRLVFCGGGFPAEDQEDVEKSVRTLAGDTANIMVVRTRPITHHDIEEKYANQPMQEKINFTTKAVLDKLDLQK
ncbi:hypothetical protein EMMF5_004520 [Cystobasidiomycetes sp. EMM_F5]